MLVWVRPALFSKYAEVNSWAFTAPSSYYLLSGDLHLLLSGDFVESFGEGDLESKWGHHDHSEKSLLSGDFVESFREGDLESSSGHRDHKRI